jgi:hypothetical protein
LAVGEPPETPFSTKKEIRRGKSQNKAKGFSGGARAGACTALGGAAQVLFSIFVLKMGSSAVVKSHQIEV